MDMRAVPLTENKPEFCSAIVEKLNLPACFTIAKLFFKFGRVSVHVLSSTYLGNKGASFLKYLRITSNNPVKIDDFLLNSITTELILGGGEKFSFPIFLKIFISKHD